MGREIKRVPVDFDWPLEKRWDGYVNPHYVECPTCGSRGETTAGQWLGAVSCILAMLGEEAAGLRIGTAMHPWLQQFPLAPTAARDLFDKLRGEHVTQRPSPDMVDLIRGLTKGKYSRDDNVFTQVRHNIYRNIVKAAGVDKGWGVCPTCQGSGIDPEHRAAYEAWESTDPPTGEGWQVWETVSEGSPVTPVFRTADDLIEYLAAFGTTWDQKPRPGGGGGPWRRDAAEAFVRAGSAPTLVVNSTGVHEGARDADKWAARA